MRYFEYFPSFEYSNEPATNLIVRARVRHWVMENGTLYYKVVIRDGERPDTMASKYYGSSDYTWLLFYANDIYDPIFDWPLSQDQFLLYLTNKVGSLKIAQETPHHYLLDNKWVIDEYTFRDVMVPANTKRMVTVYEHETSLNDQKRNIKVIDKTYAQQIMNEMRRIFD
jgi:hypothetical protein